MQNAVYESFYVIASKLPNKKLGYVIFRDYRNDKCFDYEVTKFIAKASKYGNKSEARKIARICKKCYSEVEVLEVQAEYAIKEI